jgi:Protein of unknown function (DUF2752)
MTAHVVPRTGRGAALAAPLGVATLALTAVGLVAAVDPNEPGHYPTCPFLAVTGQLCPGCGSLRAVHAMTHGDLAAALGLNLLTVLAVLPLAVIWLRWARRRWAGISRTDLAPAPVLWMLLVVVLAFGLLRNLPVGAPLAP